jgi:hypothetical protein
LRFAVNLLPIKRSTTIEFLPGISNRDNAVHRVITRYRNGTGRPIMERGPWHPSMEVAQNWQDLLRAMGYFVDIESQHVAGGNDNSDLANALSSMA